MASDESVPFYSRFLRCAGRCKLPTTSCLLYSYVPAIGAVSYATFSLHIFKPYFLESIFPESRFTVANCLLFNAHLGSGLYLYNSRHLRATTPYFRIMYSVYGALIFNFGSILLWAVTKSILSEGGFVKVIFSLSSSICMLLIGKEYVTYVDSWCSKTKQP